MPTSAEREELTLLRLVVHSAGGPSVLIRRTRRSSPPWCRVCGTLAASLTSMTTVNPSMENFQITFRDIASGGDVEARVRELATKLFAMFPKITMCRVALEAPHQRHREGRKYRCRIDLVVPNAELVAENAGESDVSEDIHAAVVETFDEVTRQLQDYVRRSRWDVKQHDGTPHGRVAKLMVGQGPGTRYGFIETHDGREIYFHENSVLHGQYDKLEVGTEVRFAEEDGEKGPQASTVAATKRRSTVGTTTEDGDDLRE
ncbi:MAG: cold shock domain-containing protein [Myxococcota bacterium]|nr:cold shock domain-containing protein [Myxococcota bacterium]